MKSPPPPPKKKTHLSKSSRLKYLFLLKQFTVILFAAISIIACNVTENNKTSSQAEITVTEIPKKTNDYRSGFVAFSIQAGFEADYRLAVRKKSKAEPDAQSIRDSAATIVRTLSADPINLFMSFQMDSTIFDAGTT